MDHGRNFDVAPLTPDRWADLEQLFGERGASSGCWCMWWRVPAKDWEANAGDGNRSVFRRIVEAGPAPGLLAYDHDAPVGWVAIAPRDDYPRLNRSPKLKPVDDVPTWAVTCFYIDRKYRGSGVGGTLLAAAVRHARASGAIAVEGYPIDPGSDRVSNASAFTGVLDMFHAAGFEEIIGPAVSHQVAITGSGSSTAGPQMNRPGVGQLAPISTSTGRRCTSTASPWIALPPVITGIVGMPPSSPVPN